MNSRREKLLSMVYATRPLTHRATNNPRVRTREIVAYVLLFVLSSAAISCFSSLANHQSLPEGDGRLEGKANHPRR